MRFRMIKPVVLNIALTCALAFPVMSSDKILDDEWGVKSSPSTASEKILDAEWGVESSPSTAFGSTMYAAMTGLHNTVKSNNASNFQTHMQALMGCMSGGENAPAATPEEMSLVMASINFVTGLLKNLDSGINLQSYLGLNTTVNHLFLHDLLSQRSPVYQRSAQAFPRPASALARSTYVRSSASLEAVQQKMEEVVNKWRDRRPIGDDDAIIASTYFAIPGASTMTAEQLHTARLGLMLIIYAANIKDGRTLF